MRTQKKKNNNFLIGLIAFILAIGFIAYKTKDNAEKINSKSVHLEKELKDFEKRVDYRFKSYDFVFFLENATIDGKPIIIDATNTEILDYYKKYKQQLTPFSEELLKGKYRDSIK